MMMGPVQGPLFAAGGKGGAGKFAAEAAGVVDEGGGKAEAVEPSGDGGGGQDPGGQGPAGLAMEALLKDGVPCLKAAGPAIVRVGMEAGGVAEGCASIGMIGEGLYGLGGGLDIADGECESALVFGHEALEMESEVTGGDGDDAVHHSFGEDDAEGFGGGEEKEGVEAGVDGAVDLGSGKGAGEGDPGGEGGKVVAEGGGFGSVADDGEMIVDGAGVEFAADAGEIEDPLIGLGEPPDIGEADGGFGIGHLAGGGGFGGAVGNMVDAMRIESCVGDEVGAGQGADADEVVEAVAEVFEVGEHGGELALGPPDDPEVEAVAGGDHGGGVGVEHAHGQNEVGPDVANEAVAGADTSGGIEAAAIDVDGGPFGMEGADVFGAVVAFAADEGDGEVIAFGRKVNVGVIEPGGDATGGKPGGHEGEEASGHGASAGGWEMPSMSRTWFSKLRRVKTRLPRSAARRAWSAKLRGVVWASRKAASSEGWR